MIRKKPVQYLSLAILLILIVLPLTGVKRYYLSLFCYIGFYAMAASGLDLLFGYSGQISLGHAGFYCVGAYASALLSKYLGIPPYITVFLGASIGALIGIVLAFPAARLKHHFLSLATIAFAEIVFLSVVHWDSVTFGFSGLTKIPALEMFGLRFNNSRNGMMNFYYLILFVVLVMLIIKHLIVKSKIGRAFVAIQESSAAASGMGINVRKYRVMAFAISAFYTSLAGAFYAHFTQYVSPDTFVLDTSVRFLTIVLFGGLASLWGPVIGAVVIVVLQELLQATGTYQMIFYGSFIIVVLLFMPKGISNSASDIWTQRILPKINQIRYKGDANVTQN